MEIRVKRKKRSIVANNCQNGKGCGASCVASWKQCVVPLSKYNGALDRVVDKVFSKEAAIKTPEAAVKWFEANKERLAGYGGGNWGDPKGDVLVLAIEPGDDPKDLYYDANSKLLSRFEGLNAEPTINTNKWGEWYDRHPLVFVNDIRQRYVVKQAARTLAEPASDGVLDGQAFRFLDDPTKNIRRDVGSFSVETVLQNKSVPYTRKLGHMIRGAGSSILGLNISPFGLPSEEFWPFNKLPFKSNSVFHNRDSWLEYAAKHSAKKIKSYMEEHPRKVVYIAASKDVHKGIFEQLAKNFGQKTERKTLTWFSKAGKPQKTNVNLFVTEKDGNRTVVIQASHPSWKNWSESALGDLNKLIRERQGG
jgi:hypothetical protein